MLRMTILDRIAVVSYGQTPRLSDVNATAIAPSDRVLGETA